MRKALHSQLLRVVLAAVLGVGIPAVVTTEASAGGLRDVTADPRIASLVRSEHVSLVIAAQRIALQDSAVSRVPAIARQLGERYAGAWFDPQTGDLVVGETAAGRPLAASELTAVASSDIRQRVRTVMVRWNDAELARVTAALSRDIAAVNTGAQTGVTLRTVPPENAVEIVVGSGPLTVRQSSFIDSALRTFGSRVLLHHEANSNLSTLDACSGYNCDPPLRGGVRISSTIGGCTLGFIVRSNSDNKLYGLTAGHCLVTGSNVVAYFANGGTHVIGPAHNVATPQNHDSGSDSGIVTIANPAPYPKGWGPRAEILVQGTWQTTYDPTYAVAATGGSMYSMRICKSGAYYGTDCGTVTGLNATDTGGYTGLGEANYVGGHGDSGAPVYAGHVAYGIHHSHWPPQQGSSTDSYYVGIGKATADLGVRVSLGS